MCHCKNSYITQADAKKCQTIVHQDLLAPALGAFLRDQVGKEVGAASRRKLHDYADWLDGIVLHADRRNKEDGKQQGARQTANADAR